MAEKSNQELLAALGVEAEPIKKAIRSPREERVIAGFEEIQRFVEETGRHPAHGEDRDIFERLYATRLDQVRSQAVCRDLVRVLDYQGLLETANRVAEQPAEYNSDEQLLEALGVEPSGISRLKHVKSRAEVRAAEEVASRTVCEDFASFKPIFDAVQAELKNGVRVTKPFKDYANIRKDDLFILSGQKAYVAEMGKEYMTDYGRKDNRLRVIYDNGTESDILLRSLQRALNKDVLSRRIIDTSPGPLFVDETGNDDQASGTIYVLRSKSDHPVIQASRDTIHKIGVTGGNVKRRIANASLDPTYLMADVEVVATYELYNINRTKLEHVLHKFFDGARLDIQVKDRFGNPVIPREWFLVPLFIVDEVVGRIKDGTISQYVYDMESVTLVSKSRV